MHFDAVFIVLFSVATAVAVGARHLKIPYTVALVLAGLAIGALHVLPAPHLTKELLFEGVLPGLVFEAALRLDFREFWSQRYALLALAVPGVVAAMALAAALLVAAAAWLGFAPGFTWTAAAVFAALTVATDPIAVVGLFRDLGAPGRLAVLMEGESLLNDGTGVALFTLAVAAAARGRFSPGPAALEFLKVAGLGAGLGAAVGYAVSLLIRRIDDPMVELTLTIIAAYGSFALAQGLGLSGVISSVAAGMLCGSGATRAGMREPTRLVVDAAWEYLAFALNSLVFLLIGLQVQGAALAAAWLPIVAAYVAVLAARAAVVFGVTGLLRGVGQRIPWSWSAVLTWGGLRGALSMVLVLSLADDFPGRAMMVDMTFGVVIVSILLQGLTVGPLMRRLGIARGRGAVTPPGRQGGRA